MSDQCPHGYPLVWRRHCPDCEREEEELAERDAEVQRLRETLERIRSELNWGDAQNAIDRVTKLIDAALSPQKGT